MLEAYKEIIYGSGFSIPPLGQKSEYCYYSQASSINPGDYIEAFIKKLNDGTYTVYGEKYYIKKLK